MKDIDIQKVRSAILSLQKEGKSEFALVVWDLLDNYVSQKPKPIVLRQDGHTFRGASAFAGLPKCQVYSWNTDSGHCRRAAVGSLVNAERSVSICAVHGEEFDGHNGGEFVQTFFGNENSVHDISLYAKTLEEQL